MPQLFQAHTLEQHTQALADYLPGGKLFAGKNNKNTNFRKFLNGLAIEIQRTEGLMIQISSEYDPRTTTQFISEWENLMGIPDCCFPGTGSLDERRRDVLTKLMGRGCSTAEDFRSLAEFMGYDIRIEYPEEKEFYPPYDVPISLITGVPASRYVWIVIGEGIVPNVPPYNVPFSLTSGQSKLQCFFNHLKPAHTLIIYRNQ